MFKQLVLGSILAFAACVVGTDGSGTVTFLDSNADGESDAIDIDGDARLDYRTPACPTCTPNQRTNAVLIDADGDALLDGLDLDLDGVSDLDLLDPEDEALSYSKCQSFKSRNGSSKQISCTNGACQCRVNNQLVKSCTATTSRACGSGNCCGF